MDDRADLLSIWVIYDHPKDFPDAWVARQWLVGSGVHEATDVMLTAPKLDTLRGRMVALGLTCLARDPADDPCIVEAWL
jgi:hypothetical protein